MNRLFTKLQQLEGAILVALAETNDASLVQDYKEVIIILQGCFKFAKTPLPGDVENLRNLYSGLAKNPTKRSARTPVKPSAHFYFAASFCLDCWHATDQVERHSDKQILRDYLHNLYEVLILTSKVL